VRFKRRVLFYVILIILPVVLGCHKRVRIADPVVVAGWNQSDFDKAARLLITACDPKEQASWLVKGSESERNMQFFCASGMNKLTEKMSMIQDPRLKELIRKYNSSKLPNK